MVNVMIASKRERLSFILLAFTCALLGSIRVASAQQFSADLVATERDVTAPAGKLRVSGDKVRIETLQFADGFFLVDAGKPAAYFVRPGARVFMEARQSSPLVRMFVTVDPDDPCRQWQTMAQVTGVADEKPWRCERAGETTIGDRKADGYRVIPPSGGEFSGWIDRQRRFPLRIKTADDRTLTVQNVRDEPQSAQLFDIPPGLRKFDPLTLVERIKQSDVWVAEPGRAQ